MSSVAGAFAICTAEMWGHVNQVDFVQQVGDSGLPFVPGLFNINVEVNHDNRGNIHLLVGLEGPTLPFPYVSHNCTVVSVVDWW